MNMEQERDKYVEVCPYCGESEIIEAYQSSYAAISAMKNKFASCALYHSICRNCGSVVRSYVTDPEKLIKKKDRRQN